MMRKPALTNITILLISLFLSSVVGMEIQTGNQVRFTEQKALLMADGSVSPLKNRKEQTGDYRRRVG